jgi:3-phosphoshikimate 1-carboxyvinyltransferase
VTPELSATAELWPAPVATAPIDATVRVPGSKSITNRALVLAAISDAPTLVRQPLVSRDTELMAGALAALGVTVTGEQSGWRVTPAPLRGPARVDVGLAGTVMRFVPPVAALADGPVTFDGDPRSRQRPLRPLVVALRALGAEIDDGGRGALPLTVRGHGRVRGGTIEIDASTSSQLLSALLLTAPRYDDGVRVRHSGPRLPSAPFIDLTVAMLRDRGASVDVTDGEWTVRPGPLAGGDIVVEPDLSSAAPFLVAPLVAGGSVRLQGWPRESLQAGAATPEVLEAMGARCRHTGAALEVTGDGGVTGIDIDLADNPELACVLAAVAAVASTPSRLRGIGHMRGHETDRLAALARELGRLGGNVVEHDDGLEIRPASLHGGTFHTYDDHRLAMAAAVLGLVVPGVMVENVATTGKTYPGFAAQWQSVVNGDAR